VNLHYKIIPPVLVGISIIAAIALYNLQAHAASTPAEVTASADWLKQNVPEIKKEQTHLDALRAEQVKRQKVLDAFSYDFDWQTLSLVKKSPL